MSSKLIEELQAEISFRDKIIRKLELRILDKEEEILQLRSDLDKVRRNKWEIFYVHTQSFLVLPSFRPSYLSSDPPLGLPIRENIYKFQDKTNQQFSVL